MRDQWRRPFSNQSEASIYRAAFVILLYEGVYLQAGLFAAVYLPAVGVLGFALVVMVSLSILFLYPKYHLVAFVYLACMLWFILHKVVLFPSSKANMLIRYNEFSNLAHAWH